MRNLSFRGHDVLLLNTCLGDEEEQKRIEELLWVDSTIASNDSGKRRCHFFLWFFYLNIDPKEGFNKSQQPLAKILF